MAIRMIAGLGVAGITLGATVVACGPSTSGTPENTMGSTSASNSASSAPPVTTSAATTTADMTSGPNTCDGPGDAYVSQMLNGGVCETTAPPNCLINEFSATFLCEDGGSADGVGDCTECCWGDDTSLSGGSFTYKDSLGSTVAFAPGSAADSIVVTGETVLDADSYSGIGLWFGPCTDASMWDGLEIQVTGSLGGGALFVQLQTDQNYPSDGTKGSCPFTSEDTKWTECNNGQVQIPEITADGLTPIKLTWDQFVDGKPTPELDPHQLLGVQIQVGCDPVDSPELTAPCAYSLEVHDLRWFKNETL